MFVVPAIHLPQCARWIKNTYSQCDRRRQTCYYSAHLTDGNAISKSVFMIWIYYEPLMTSLYFAAFYMTVTPLLASARKPPRHLWSFGISFTAVCQLHVIPACERNCHFLGFRVKRFMFNFINILIVKVQKRLQRNSWRASAKSKYWCNHCYFQCWHTVILQFILLFTTLFIQPVQIQPQTPPPSFRPYSISRRSFLLPQIFAFPLDLCVMSWLGSDRHCTQDCLQR